MYSQLPSIPGGRSSIRNPRTRHAVVTGTHLTWIFLKDSQINYSVQFYFIYWRGDLTVEWPVTKAQVQGDSIDKQSPQQS
jgi:hypothetical protein